jgi:hypothetical protein
VVGPQQTRADTSEDALHLLGELGDQVSGGLSAAGYDDVRALAAPPATMPHIPMAAPGHPQQERSDEVTRQAIFLERPQGVTFVVFSLPGLITDR